MKFSKIPGILILFVGVFLLANSEVRADELGDAVTNKVLTDHRQNVQSGSFASTSGARNAAQPESAKRAGVISGAPVAAAMRSHPAGGASSPQPKKIKQIRRK
jgi:hypothetical protein